ncbi:hypothetical protein RFI_00776, partial [Reticulomyxa filosa]
KNHYNLEIQTNHHWNSMYIFNGITILTSVIHIPNGLVSFLIILGTFAQSILKIEMIYQIEFNSFNVIWEDIANNSTHKEPLNPYSTAFKQGIRHVQHNLQMRIHFMSGMDELILFECEFDKCKPAISSKISKMNDPDVLLHDIYKHLPHYPIIQVYWEIISIFMVPYKRTIGIERNNLVKSIPFQDIVLSSKTKFNPLLYECDLHKLKIIEDTVNIKLIRNNQLQKLLHEIIKIIVCVI